ncbi:restriction endonuclease subunit S [Paracidovorax sp. MALMAid1276]|uniref:restriction endonuclease subunit S n=1 Tax=Paracidovorax sp. MALMAid1276 TaxID=3411631 RepID=UPI003B9B5DEC
MLLSNMELIATAPGGVAKLRELILTLAVQGKLVPQDPADEPAGVLLQKIRAEKDRLIAEGKIKRDKPLAEIGEEEKPFELPQGWEWVRLGDLCSYIQRGKGPVYAENSEHRVVSQKCVRWHGLDLAPARFVTPESLAKYEPIRFLQAGDLLWNSTGTGTIGRACLVSFEHGSAGLVADSHVTVVRPLQISSWFLWRWIQSPYVQSEIEGSASGTTNQIELNTSTVVSHLVPLPPLAEQSRIVTRVEALMRLCDALEAKGQLEAAQHAQLVSTLLGTLTASTTPEELAAHWQRVAQHFDLLLDRPEAIDALEQTLLQLAVRGLLVPQDPTDESASALLQKIRAEKDRLIATGQIKRDKPLPPITDEEKPFELPVGWEWVRFDELIHPQKPIAYGVLVPGPDVSTGVPFVRIADLSITNPPERPEKTITPEVDAQFPRTRLEGGEILMGVVGSIGKLGVAPKTWAGANIARAICRIVPADVGLHEFVLFLLAGC